MFAPFEAAAIVFRFSGTKTLLQAESTVGFSGKHFAIGGWNDRVVVPQMAGYVPRVSSAIQKPRTS